MLVYQENVDMIIAREAIHKGKYLTTGTIINNLVNQRGEIIVLRTSTIYVPIINVHTNYLLFLHVKNNS